MSKVIASMATFKLRINSLKDSVDSIINQVDELRIYLNDYTNIPNFLINDKIKTFIGSQCDGDIKAKGKFYKCDEIVGYHITIDDDLIYPPDYISTYLRKMNEYNNSVIITSLGKVTKPNSLNYYRDNNYTYHFQRETENDYSVHMGGTGVMMYHTDIFKPNYNEILNGSYVDLFIGIQALTQRIPIITIKHKSDWIIFNDKEFKNLKTSLYDTGNLNHKSQTNLMNSINWEILIPEITSLDYSVNHKIEVKNKVKKKSSGAISNGKNEMQPNTPPIEPPKKEPELKPIINSNIPSTTNKLHIPNTNSTISKITNDTAIGKLRKNNLRISRR